jgi:hypothetical protein
MLFFNVNHEMIHIRHGFDKGGKKGTWLNTTIHFNGDGPDHYKGLYGIDEIFAHTSTLFHVKRLKFKSGIKDTLAVLNALKEKGIAVSIKDFEIHSLFTFESFKTYDKRNSFIHINASPDNSLTCNLYRTGESVVCGIYTKDQAVTAFLLDRKLENAFQRILASLKDEKEERSITPLSKRIKDDLRLLHQSTVKVIKKAYSFTEEFNVLLPSLPKDDDELLKMQFEPLFNLVRRYDSEIFTPYRVPRSEDDAR